MHITKQTDFSLRLLIYLAVQPERICTIREVSAAYHQPGGHTLRVVHELGKAGFIETARGRGGGMRLARSPADIKLGAVFRFTEQNLVLVEYFRPATDSCPVTNNCDLQSVFQEALRAFLSVLDRYSLQDLTENRHKLRALLSADDHPA